MALEDEAERLHEYAASVVIQSGQQDRHERNRRHDEGVRVALYRKGQQGYLRFPKGNFGVGRGCTKLQ